MQREKRYLVFKISDLNKYLTVGEVAHIATLATHVDNCRTSEGRPELEGVFVEADWPEFLPTWAAIEKRVDAETPAESDKRHYCNDGYWWEITRGPSSVFIEIGKNNQILEHECFLSDNSAYQQKNKWLTKYGMFCLE